MTDRTRLVAVIALLCVTRVAGAGGPAPENREATFARACRGGSNRNNPCTDAVDCPGGTCKIVLAKENLSALVTIIVDDNVSKYDGTEAYTNVVAATVLVEISKNGTKHLLAQTYQNLKGADLTALVTNLRDGEVIGDTIAPVTESTMAVIVPTAAILNRFLVQSIDAPLADALRTLAGSVGNPLIVGVPSRLEQVAFEPHPADPLASALRLKVRIGFTAP